MKRTVLTVVAVFLTAIHLIAQDAPQLTRDNIDEVISAMTLEEKASLLVGNGWGEAIGGITGGSLTLVPGAAGTTRAIPRLGIPSVVLADGPAGLRINPTRDGTDDTFCCTGFPIGTLMASTWNTELVYQVGAAMGNEVLERGVDVILGPGMNLHRNPLNGRNFEYYSEDPLLVGETAAAMINGIQSNGVGTSAKHFAFNNQETNRLMNDARVSPRTARELYLKGFEIAVRKAQPWTIMSSYNKINGIWAESNRELLTSILRDDWGFKGLVMTDWTIPRVTSDQVNAGNDLMEPGMPMQVKEIVEKVGTGEIPQENLDICVRRVLELVVKTPRFLGYRYSDKPDLEAHAAVTRNAASEGMVLLKNENEALPFKGIATVALFGVSSYETIAGGTGSGNVNKPYVISLDKGLENAGIALLPQLADYYSKYSAYEKIRRKVDGTEKEVLVGEEKVQDPQVSLNLIRTSEAASDMAVITVGRNSGEAMDRFLEGDFRLTREELQLISQTCDVYHSAGKKVVVVLNVGGVVETASWSSLPDAILLAWQPGQEAGNSIADVLTGVRNPSGRLPMTWPLSFYDIPSSRNFPIDCPEGQFVDYATGQWGRTPTGLKNIDFSEYAEGINVGYRYFTTAGKSVAYPFGYGLSYTTFAYSKAAAGVAKDGSVKVKVTVTNTGDAAGKEVVQVYVSAPAGGLEKPVRELKAFAKTRLLNPGESQTLEMTIDNYSLASFNENVSAWETARGTYGVHVGANVEDIRCNASFKLSKAQRWPVNDVLHLK